MENGWITWLIVVGLVALQFVGSNKKKKAAEARKRAILEERMRQAARQDYGYDTSDLETELEEMGAEEDYPAAVGANRSYSEDPFDFLNMSDFAEKVERAIQGSVNSLDYTTIEEPAPIAADQQVDSYYDNNIAPISVAEEFAAEGVRSTVDDDPDAIGGVNDEAGLYINEEELTMAKSPVIASFDPKLFILYSEIARPKYQD